MLPWNQTTSLEMLDFVYDNATMTTIDVETRNNGDFLTMDQYYDAMKVSLAIGFLLCIGGVVGNILNIRTFLRIGLDDCMTVVFFNLAISDLMVICGHLSTAIPTVCVILQMELNIFFVMSPFDVSVIIITATKTFNFATKLLTTFLALQRTLCVVIPLHFKGVFTRSRTFIITAAIWAYCVTVGVTLMFQYQFVTLRTPNRTSYFLTLRPKSQFFKDLLKVFITFINGIFLNTASLIIVFVCVVAVKIVLMRSVNFRKENVKPKSIGDEKEQVNSNQNQNPDKSASQRDNISGVKERQAITQVLIVSIVFLISGIPHLLNVFLNLGFRNTFGMYKKYHFTYATFYSFRLVFEQFNSAVNIFIYYKYNTKFRELCFKKKLK